MDGKTMVGTGKKIISKIKTIVRRMAYLKIRWTIILIFALSKSPGTDLDKTDMMMLNVYEELFLTWNSSVPKLHHGGTTQTIPDTRRPKKGRWLAKDASIAMCETDA